jgi:MFS transporter, FSR family, fosmidomycin resistance protein
MPYLMHRKSTLLLMFAHVASDLTQGAVAGFLPVFVAERHWSYATAGTLLLALNLSSSVVQPAFGHWADRISCTWLIPVGLATAGAGLALTGWMPTYHLVIAALALAGVGVAAFHPAAARALHSIAGEKRATAMGIFTVGGNIGFAIGPLLATGVVLLAGLRGSAVLLIPVWAMAALVVANLRRFPSDAGQSGHPAAGSPRSGSRNTWGGFAALASAIFCRSAAFVALNAFLAPYWIHALGQTRAHGGLALSLLLGAGAAGTVLGGWMADRYGRKTVIVSGLIVAGLLLFVMIALNRAEVEMPLLVPLGLAFFAPSSVMVTLGQEYLPERVGLSSGVTLGLSVTVGGLAAPLLGGIVDRHGFEAMFAVAGGLSLGAGLISTLLPRPKHAGKVVAVTETLATTPWASSIDAGR